MYRKFVLALGAAAVIGAAALSPTAASAKGWKHHHWHHGWGPGFGLNFVVGNDYPDCYIVRRVVWTHHGKRIRRVEICD